MDPDRKKEKYYIVIKGEKLKYELFELFLYPDQVIISPSIPYIKNFHFTQHQPSKKWHDIGWHLKGNENSNMVLLDRRSDFIDGKIKEIGFITLRNHIIKKCKIFNRKKYNDIQEFELSNIYTNYTFYFFRSSKSTISKDLKEIQINNKLHVDSVDNTISDNLQEIKKNNKTNAHITSFYFESVTNIVIGVILIQYGGSKVHFLDLTNINGMLQFYEYIRIDKDGNIKKEAVVKPPDNSIEVNGNNFLPCGGVIIE